MVCNIKDGLAPIMYPLVGGGFSSLYSAIHDLHVDAGQSNVIGRADMRPGIDDVYTDIIDRVFQFGYNSLTVTPATNPLDHYNEFAGDMGLWLEFVKARLPFLTEGRKILIVPVGRGGTGFSTNHWNPPNDPQYVAMVSRINQAMALHPKNRLASIKWLQGETDADAGATAASLHQEKLQAMYNAMLTSVTGMTLSTPFLVGSIKPNKPNATLINNGLQAFAAANDAVQYVDLTDLTFFDSDHYSAAALATAGQRFASKL